MEGIYGNCMQYRVDVKNVGQRQGMRLQVKSESIQYIFIIGITQGIWYEHGVAIWLSEKWITVVNRWQMIQGHVFGYNSNK